MCSVFGGVLRVGVGGVIDFTDRFGRERREESRPLRVHTDFLYCNEDVS